MAELAREIHICHLLHEGFRTLAVFNQGFYRNQAEIMLLGKLNEFRRAHHMAVIVHDFAAKACGIETGKTCQIRGGFRMTSTTQYAALYRTQREYMARTAEARCLGLGV